MKIHYIKNMNGEKLKIYYEYYEELKKLTNIAVRKFDHENPQEYYYLIFDSVNIALSKYSNLYQTKKSQFVLLLRRIHLNIVYHSIKYSVVQNSKLIKKYCAYKNTAIEEIDLELTKFVLEPFHYQTFNSFLNKKKTPIVQKKIVKMRMEGANNLKISKNLNVTKRYVERQFSKFCCDFRKYFKEYCEKQNIDCFNNTIK